MINSTINGYTIKKHLGEGGMADVYYAENSLGIPAAIKVLKKKFSDEPAVHDRFIEEAKIMVTLDHPNIRKVLDLGEVDQRPAILMEYLAGKSLKELIHGRKLIPEEKIKKYFEQCVAALKYTGKRGVIHRDIKPSNIFLTASDEVKILDFGIAKSKEGIRHTQTGQTLGTIVYMSPEQVEDPKRVDYKTDIYSLAVTFYHVLTGKTPYDLSTDSDFKVQTKIVNESLDLTKINPYWRDILKSYLVKNPKERKELTEIISDQKMYGEDRTVISIPTKKSKQKKEQENKKYGKLWIGSIVGFVILAVLGFYFIPFINQDENELIVYQENELFGYKNSNGEIIIPAKYELATAFDNGRAKVIVQDSVYYIDNNGLIIELCEPKLMSTLIDVNNKLIRGYPKEIDKRDLSNPLKDLYKIYGKYTGLETYEDFEKVMSISDARKEFFDAFGEFLNGIDDFKMFETVLGLDQGADIHPLDFNTIDQSKEPIIEFKKFLVSSGYLPDSISDEEFAGKIRNPTYRKKLHVNLIDRGYVSEGVSQEVFNRKLGIDQDMIYHPIDNENSSKLSLIIDQIDRNMVFVKGGTFTMGCTPEQENKCYKYETPKHQVSLSSYRINKYELTQKEWNAVMKTNSSDLNYKDCDYCPVVDISWDDVHVFIDKLNRLSHNHYRLPTEAEWEFAARGGKNSKGYRYSGSNTLATVAWNYKNSKYKTHPVGQKDANELGIYDMSGNVSEFCEDDWHKDYSGASINGMARINSPRSSYRVFRGGAFNQGTGYCRVSYRYIISPSRRKDFIGFRLAHSIK